MDDEDFEEVTEVSLRRRTDELEADLSALDRLMDKAEEVMNAFDVACAFDENVLDTWLQNAPPERVRLFHALLDALTRSRLEKT